MYYNIFISQSSSRRDHYLVWDEYSSKKTARNAARYFNKRYYTYVKTISAPLSFVPDDGTTMEYFPVTSDHYGIITYDR